MKVIEKVEEVRGGRFLWFGLNFDSPLNCFQTFSLSVGDSPTRPAGRRNLSLLLFLVVTVCSDETLALSGAVFILGRCARVCFCSYDRLGVFIWL